MALAVVAASWGAFGSIPGSPGFSSFPAPLTLTVGVRRCPQVGTSFEAAQVSLVGCAVPAHRSSNGSGSALSTAAPGVRRSTC